jgi:hypothetical protein
MNTKTTTTALAIGDEGRNPVQLQPCADQPIPPGFVYISEFKSLDARSFAGGRLMSWADFCKWFTTHCEVERKDGVGLFNFARLCRSHRTDASVLDVSALMLDLDDASQEALNALVVRLQGYAWAYATTHSHGVNSGNRYRVVVQLTRPVARHEWARFAAGVRLVFGSAMDKCLHSCSQSYYRTSCPPARVACKAAGQMPGAPLDVDGLLARAPVVACTHIRDPRTPEDAIARYVVPEAQRRVPTRDEIQAFIEQSGREIAHDARCMFLTGEAWGMPKQRDDRLHRLAYALLCFYPWVQPEQTAALAMLSCAAVEREDGRSTTVEWVGRKLRSKIGPAAVKTSEIDENRRIVDALRTARNR